MKPMEIEQRSFAIIAEELGDRKIDPEYGDYSPGIFLAQDGTPWAKIEEVNGEGGGWLGLCPVLIPFDKLEKTDKTYGLKVLQYNP